MYRLLIVDDERIIVEGLASMFGRRNLPDVEIHTAGNGMDALDIARKQRIDILLSDISMPEMDGIALQKEMSRCWPRCRVVFLSGYNDFQYVQHSMRGGALDYVLKTEGDEAIVAAVRKAIAEIEEELQQERLMSRAKSELRAALPALRKEYLMELLAGAPSTEESRQRRFEELDVPLRWDKPVLSLAGRVDAWRDDQQPGDRELFLYSVNNMFEEFIGSVYDSIYVVHSRNRFLWLMQPKEAGEPADEKPEDRSRFLSGMAESLQEACSRFLKLSCSFVVGTNAVDWEALSGQLERYSFLFAVGLGSGSEMLLADHPHHPHLEAGQRIDRAGINRIPVLGQHLDDKDREAFVKLLGEVSDTLREHERDSGALGMKLEAFSSISAVFAAHLNRRGLFNDFAGRFPARKLFSIEEHDSWEAAARFFTEVADSLFERGTDDNEKEADRVVRKLHDYIEMHLEEPLSLTQLADVVYLTPSYLSRLYKRKTGDNMTDYIIERKIRESKRMLTETPFQIQAIGERIGYPSPSYFSRFFKRETGMTPQEYRDAFKST
ncbi:response regulator [Cohnella sp. GCM10027633]|uniref:response regulator n=1 Tax=unclassified Cohnella TaxID=2636738 RepID=UPI00362BA4D4